MRRISHDTYSTLINVVYLGLITNALLLVSSLPVVLLLVTTDPTYSWPLLAIAAPLSAPGITGAFSAFRAYGRGETTPARAFIAGWRASWRRAMVWGALVVVVVVVLLVDVRMLASAAAGVVIVPVLGVLTVITAAIALVGLAGIAEAPKARLRDVLKATAYLSVRRWYLSVVSLLVVGTQLAVFINLPAVGIGLTAAPALYLAWANSRFTLRPVLETEDGAAHQPALQTRTSH
jgi:uncharacterized membrane protein YesL